ncbi:MAG: hypothetical protein DRP56_09045 [Planctomycetota bacterium]|nr:MAG: hypothetical protein DRP56_09045 [Planctomycetota bacterium]
MENTVNTEKKTELSASAGGEASECSELLYGDWRPIETAPKNFDWILLGYYPEYMEGKCVGGYPKIAYWDGDTWVDCCGKKFRNDGTSFSPSHWMPLPPPPTM